MGPSRPDSGRDFFSDGAEGASLDAEARQRIDAAVERVRQAMAGGDGERLQQALDDLNRQTQPLAERLMNAVVRKTLEGRQMSDVRPGQL
jgi:hypothetical protein